MSSQGLLTFREYPGGPLYKVMKPLPLPLTIHSVRAALLEALPNDNHHRREMYVRVEPDEYEMTISELLSKEDRLLFIARPPSNSRKDL